MIRHNERGSFERIGLNIVLVDGQYCYDENKGSRLRIVSRFFPDNFLIISLIVDVLFPCISSSFVLRRCGMPLGEVLRLILRN